MAEHEGKPTFEGILLPSKIRIPAQGGPTVERRRAAAKLARALQARLTMLVAPAGYGKTTAALSWATGQREATVAWYATGPEDRSVERFWLYLEGALAAADPQLAGTLDEDGLYDTFAKSLPAIDAAIIRLYAYGRPLAIVLEDLHCVADGNEIMASLRHLVRHMPPHVHVVATSRRPLSLPLAKMRVEGALVEVGEDDLAFGPEETARFFQMQGLELSAGQLDEVAGLTHGWPAGCRLVALLCADGATPPGDRSIDRARDDLQDYLFEEVLESIDPAVARFMVETSLVDSFDISLAKALTGLPLDQVMACIDAVVRDGLFVECVGRDGGEAWYRYQPLLADLLRNRSARLDQGELLRIYDRIFRWYEANGYLEAAVEVATRIHDYARIRQLIVDNWERLYMDDAHHVLLRWAANLPQGEILCSPFVCAALSMPLALRGENGKAHALLRHAVENLKDDQDFLFALCAVQKAFLASFEGKDDDMRILAEKALRFLPESEAYLRGMMMQIQAAAHLGRCPLEARALFARAVDAQLGEGNRLLSCSALCNLAVCDADLGYMAEARHYAEQALSLYDEPQRREKPMLSYAWLSLALADYEKGDLDRAERACDAAEESMRDSGMADKRAEVLALRAKIACRRGAPGASETLSRALAVNEPGALRALPQLPLVRGCAEAMRSRSLERLASRDAPAATLLFDAAVAYCLDAAAHCEEACSLADAEDPSERSLFVRANVLAAAFCEKAARTKAAERYLARGARVALECGLPSALTDNAALVAPVADRLARTAEGAGLAAFLRASLSEPSRTEGEAARLTEREIDVMRRVAAGMSVAAAADDMVVSRETVKKHLANIYAKLGVHSKMQAVALLRDQGAL